MPLVVRPMPLVSIPEPFDHPDWLYEIKHDGFRALAIVEGHRCQLVSRRGHIFSKWDVFCTEISHSIRAHAAIVDGEIVCLDADGRSNFHKLLFRREWPHCYAFDVLSVEGENVCDRPLVERKRILRRLMPRFDSRLLYVDCLPARGCDLFRAVCPRSRGHRREVGPRIVSPRWHQHVVDQDQEPAVFASGRPTRAVRPPARSTRDASPLRARAGALVDDGRHAAMSDNYSPFAPQPERKPRTSTVVFVVTRQRAATFETMTGSLRDVDAQRWEALYLLNGGLYSSQLCDSRALAEAHLQEHRDVLEAAGWTRQAIEDPT